LNSILDKLHPEEGLTINASRIDEETTSIGVTALGKFNLGDDSLINKVSAVEMGKFMSLLIIS